MGAEREASVRVVVRKESAIQDLRTLSNETERFTRATRSGLEESTRAASGLVGTLKQGVGMAASFFGLHAGIGLVRDAMQIREEFQRINFSMEAGKGILRSWSASMADVWAINRRWGQDVGALTRSYGTLYEELGKGPDELASVLDRVARAATASGKPIERLADLGVVLSEKWDVPTEQLDDAFRTIFSLTSQGGVRLEEFMGQAARLGPKARKAGLSGTEDLANLLGFMNRAEQGIATPRQGAMAIGGLIDLLSGDSVEKTQKLRKAGVRGELIKGAGAVKDPFDMMREIVAATGGDRGKIEQAFGRGSPMADVLTELARPYRDAAAGGGTPAEKRAAGLKAYDDAVNESRRVMMSKSRYEEIAAERSQEAGANVERAMASVKEAFTKPEVLNAATQLANSLAALTVKVAEFTDSELFKKTAGIVDKAGPGGLLAGWLSWKGLQAAGRHVAEGVTSGGGGEKLLVAKKMVELFGGFGTFAGPMLAPMAVAGLAEANRPVRMIGSRTLSPSRRMEVFHRAAAADGGGGGSGAGNAPALGQWWKRVLDERGEQLGEDVPLTDEEIAEWQKEDQQRAGMGDGSVKKGLGLLRPGHAIDQAGIMTAQILAAKRGRSPLQNLAYSVAPGIAGAGVGPLASLTLAGQIEGANRQAEARASMMDARGVGPAPGVALEALPNAIANPIVRALVALQTGTLRVEVVNTPKQGAPRNTQGP